VTWVIAKRPKHSCAAPVSSADTQSEPDRLHSGGTQGPATALFPALRPPCACATIPFATDGASWRLESERRGTSRPSLFYRHVWRLLAATSEPARPSTRGLFGDVRNIVRPGRQHTSQPQDIWVYRLARGVQTEGEAMKRFVTGLMMAAATAAAITAVGAAAASAGSETFTFATRRTARPTG